MSRLERCAVRLQAGSVVQGRRSRRGEAGSQSLEWVGLGMVVAGLMGAAYHVAASDGGGVGHAIIDRLTKALQPQ